MTPEQAEWVRANAWLPSMRRQLWGGPDGTTYDAALALSVCACMGDVCHSCEGGRHQPCDRWALKPWPEWWLTNRPLNYIPPTAVWLAGRTCRSLCPCSCPRQMTKGEAAWVRENVWPRALAASLGPVGSCPCQYGPSTWCLHGNCGRCQGSEPTVMPETYVTDKTGLVPLAAGFRDGHPAVWLADRVCRWTCGHDCHAAPEPQAEQLDLFAEVA